MISKIVLATTNAHKITEIQALFGSEKVTLLCLSDFHPMKPIIETGTTFKENAFIKARAVLKHTGMPSLGEDSGLVVEAMKGAPGIYSRRYAGQNATSEACIKKLLDEMKSFSGSERKAYFWTSLVLCWQDEKERHLYATGKIEGHLTTHPQGSGGFGYDPIFIPEGYQKTFADLPAHVKQQCSHRASAVKHLLDQLTQPLSFKNTQK